MKRLKWSSCDEIATLSEISNNSETFNDFVNGVNSHYNVNFTPDYIRQKISVTKTMIFRKFFPNAEPPKNKILRCEMENEPCNIPMGLSGYSYFDIIEKTTDEIYTETGIDKFDILNAKLSIIDRRPDILIQRHNDLAALREAVEAETKALKSTNIRIVWVPFSEACKLLGCSSSAIYRWHDSGMFKKQDVKRIKGKLHLCFEKSLDKCQ